MVAVGMNEGSEWMSRMNLKCSKTCSPSDRDKSLLIAPKFSPWDNPEPTWLVPGSLATWGQEFGGDQNSGRPVLQAEPEASCGCLELPKEGWTQPSEGGGGAGQGPGLARRERPRLPDWTGLPDCRTGLDCQTAGLRDCGQHLIWLPFLLIPHHNSVKPEQV